MIACTQFSRRRSYSDFLDRDFRSARLISPNVVNMRRDVRATIAKPAGGLIAIAHNRSALVVVNDPWSTH